MHISVSNFANNSNILDLTVSSSLPHPMHPTTGACLASSQAEGLTAGGRSGWDGTIDGADAGGSLVRAGLAKWRLGVWGGGGLALAWVQGVLMDIRAGRWEYGGGGGNWGRGRGGGAPYHEQQRSPHCIHWACNAYMQRFLWQEEVDSVAHL